MIQDYMHSCGHVANIPLMYKEDVASSCGMNHLGRYEGGRCTHMLTWCGIKEVESSIKGEKCEMGPSLLKEVSNILMNHVPKKDT